jgi:hypothetical protein
MAMRARVPCPQSVASPWLPPRVVPNQIISYTLRTAKDPLQAARRLAAKAFSAGAKDNVSLRRSPFGRPTPRKGRSQELTHSKMRAQASFPSAQKYGSGYGPSNSQLQEALKNKHFSANMAERESALRHWYCLYFFVSIIYPRFYPREGSSMSGTGSKGSSRRLWVFWCRCLGVESHALGQEASSGCRAGQRSRLDLGRVV